MCHAKNIQIVENYDIEQMSNETETLFLGSIDKNKKCVDKDWNETVTVKNEKNNRTFVSKVILWRTVQCIAYREIFKA